MTLKVHHYFTDTLYTIIHDADTYIDCSTSHVVTFSDNSICRDLQELRKTVQHLFGPDLCGIFGNPQVTISRLLLLIAPGLNISARLFRGPIGRG